MLNRKDAANSAESPSGTESSARSSGYASPSIIARRHRILDETRRMIGEVGITKRANVAKRTLYNAFQSKEHLVASAISKYFEDYASRIDYSTEDATLEWMIERLVIVARRNLSIRNYTRALMNIYFSSNVDPEIRQAIHEIASKSHEPWILELDRKQQLAPWIDAEDLIAMLVRLRYATAHAWAEGLIPDDQLVYELLRSFFTLMAGSTCGSARDEIVGVLENLEENPLLK
jgi:TetR/AcrR family transcriptional regulator, cholesterol catabolism regulator